MIAESVQVDANAVVLIDVLASGKMSTHLPRSVVTDENRIQILFVVRKVSGGLFAGGISVSRNVLAEIIDDQFRFARVVFKEVLQLRSAVHPWNARKRNGSPPWRRQNGQLSRCRSGETQDHTPKIKYPSPGPHADHRL